MFVLVLVLEVVVVVVVDTILVLGAEVTRLAAIVLVLRIGPLVGPTVAYPPRLLMSLLFETFRPKVGLFGVGLLILVVPAPGLLLALRVFMA